MASFGSALKRSFDLAASLVFLVLGLPVFLFVALAIKSDDGGPVFFLQTRIGRNGKPFRIVKFRTMAVKAPQCATRELDDPGAWITRTGAFLRRTSLDELPQVLNIIAGHMSFVGPRPLIPQETLVHDLRHQSGVYRFRPGITGLAQVEGRDLVDDRTKAAWDACYVESWSPMVDALILLRTCSSVARAEGVAEGRQQLRA